MDNKIIFRKKELHFKTWGSENKPPVILLHGYLESGKIYEDFCQHLKDDFFLICPDTPGHGKSEVFDTIHKMEDLAEAVDCLAEHFHLDKFHLTGHSMGGYIALACLDLFPHKLASIVLFHSTSFTDTEEKKLNRTRETELIKNHKKELIINTNIPRAFAEKNLILMPEKIEWAKQIGIATQDEGIIALLKGMMLRTDKTEIFYKSKIPKMVIAGELDNYIPIDIMKKTYHNGTDIELVSLSNSGHMGFVEEPEESSRILRSFFSENPC